MRAILMAGILAFLAGGALGGAIAAAEPSDDDPLILHRNRLPGVMELGASACLRGPIRVFDNKSRRVIFALKAGAWYPPGCADAKPATWWRQYIEVTSVEVFTSSDYYRFTADGPGLFYRSVLPGGVVIFAGPTPATIMELGAQGCLRGPLKVFDPSNGRVMFSLQAGEWYPVGCADAPTGLR